MFHHLGVLALTGALGASAVSAAERPVAPTAQEPDVPATWARLAWELETLVPGAPQVGPTWQSARELRELGNVPPAALEEVARARVQRAVGSELSVFTRELELAAAAGFATPEALAAAALDTLAQAPQPDSDLQLPAAWARADVLQRTLGIAPNVLAPFAAGLVLRALERGEDPLAERIARSPGLGAAVAPAFERWFRERVFTGEEVHRGVLFAARSSESYPEAVPRALVTDGRLARALLTALAEGPGAVELGELALLHADVLALTSAEPLVVARVSLAGARLETPDLGARLAHYLALAGANPMEPVCLRASFLVAVRARDWDAVLRRLEAAKRAGALTAVDAPVVAAVEAEVARRAAELADYANLDLAGEWSVAFFVDGRREAAPQRVELYRRREGAVEFLRCTLSGPRGELGTAFSTLFDPRKRTLALKFDRYLVLEPLGPVMELTGSMRLFEPRGTAFEWTLDSPGQGPRLSMIWTR